MKRANDYTLIESSIGNDPAIVVIDSAVDFLGDCSGYEWNIRIWIRCKDFGQKGLPTADELVEIEKAEEQISAALSGDGNSIFFARITARGERILIYRAKLPGLADAALQRLIAAGVQAREWSYRIDSDHDFKLIEPELTLLASVVRTN